jgi:hypothetical protein
MPFEHVSHKRTVGPQKFGIARQISGAISNDVGPYTFASYPHLTDNTGSGSLPSETDTAPITGAFLGGTRHDTLRVGASFVGSGSIKLVPMFPDYELERWIPLLDASGVATKSPVLESMKNGGGVWEFWCFGDKVFFMIQDKTGTVEDLEIVVRPGRPRIASFY